MGDAADDQKNGILSIKLTRGGLFFFLSPRTLSAISLSYKHSLSKNSMFKERTAHAKEFSTLNFSHACDRIAVIVRKLH